MCTLAALAREESRGGHFDPDVVEAFLDRAEEFDEVRRRLADEEPVETRVCGPNGRQA